MIEIHGNRFSRTPRCIWMLEELGVEYRLVETSFDEIKSPDFLALNPNGRIPTLVDGDLVLWESMAINLYLAEKFGGDLWPETPEQRAKAIQWSFWGMTEMEHHLHVALTERVFAPEKKRDEKKALAAEQALQRPIMVLNSSLEGRDYLLGEGFSVADLNVAAVISWAKPARVMADAYPDVVRWAEACLTRPGFRKAIGRA